MSDRLVEARQSQRNERDQATRPDHPRGSRLSRVIASLKRIQAKDWVATLVAALALAVSVWAGYVEREHQRLTSRPFLHIGEAFAPSSPRHGLVIFNFGLGVAFIDAFQIYFDGKPLSGNWEMQWTQFRNRTGITQWTDRGAHQPGDVVPPNYTQNSEILLIVQEGKGVAPTDPLARSAELKEVVKRHLSISIVYHSMYGETFAVTKTGLQPQEFWKKSVLGSFEKWKP